MQGESRKAKTFSRSSGLIVLALASALALGGCGKSNSPGTVMSSINSKMHKSRQPAPPAKADDQGMAEMVSAASPTKGGPPIQLKFALQQRPEIGQPLDVAIALIPESATLDSVSASFAANEGLDLVEGAEMPQSGKPVLGTPLRHTLRLVPKRDGIFAVTVVVNVESANTRATKNFSIPVIAGDGLAEPAAKSGPGTPAPTSRPAATKG